MKDIIGDTAQELADHLDDLRETGEGVTNYNEDTGLGQAVENHPVTEVGDAELDKGFATMFRPSASFMVAVAGQRLRVTVSGE